jgi:hypothetical protein
VDRRQLKFMSSKPLRQMRRWYAHARTMPRGVAIAKGGDARLTHGRHVGGCALSQRLGCRPAFRGAQSGANNGPGGEYHHAS